MEETKLQRILMELRTDLDMLLERYYSGATKEIQEKLSSLSTLVTELQTKVSTLDSDNTTNKTDIESIKADIVNIKSKCEEFTTNIANLQSTVTQNTSDITSLTTRITTAETDIDDLQTLTASHTETLNDHWDKIVILVTEAISMTTKMSNAEERITALENKSATGNPEISKADITALQTKVDTLETKVDDLTTKVTTNTTNIADLTSKVNTNTTNIATNTTDIATLKTTTENIISTVSELQTTVATNTQNISDLQSTVSTNTTNIQTNADNISALQSQVNTNTENIVTNTTNIATNTANIATNTNNIATLMAFRDSIITPPDPYYNPKTFSDYPAGTILQGYAKFDRRVDIKYSIRMKTPVMNFSAENESAGNIKFKLNWTTTKTFEGAIKVYQNDTVIYSENAQFNNEDLTCEWEKELKGITLADGNSFYVQVDFNPASNSIYLKRMQCELVAPNAEVTNQISPYNVDVINGKYYISDCSSGTAKIAEIEIENMHNMSNLEWTDTGIECIQYKTAFNTNQYGYTYQLKNRVDYYFTGNKAYFINKTLEDTSVVELNNCIMIDWLPMRYSFFSFNAILSNSTYSQYITLNEAHTTTNKNNRLDLSSGYITSSKFWTDLLTNSYERSAHVETQSNGHNYIATTHVYSGIKTDVGHGIYPHVYLLEHNANVTYVDVYLKHYDKILRKKYKMNSSKVFTLEEAEEIGAYEEYFEGANNDYFVVKNGVLEYHKKPVQTETDTSDDTNTDSNT